MAEMEDLARVLAETRLALEAARMELEQVRQNGEVEISSLKQQVSDLDSQRTRESKGHEATLARVRKAADEAVIGTALRAEAIRLGAYNPDDILRILDVSEVIRGEDGQVSGVAEVLERARAERGYLFAAEGEQPVRSGTTVGGQAPSPGGGEAFDARRAGGTEYEARKWQFLRGG